MRYRESSVLERQWDMVKKTWRRSYFVEKEQEQAVLNWIAESDMKSLKYHKI